ncbi:IPT/TIG domain-containing protein [Sphaerisporangium sp. NPDC051017]|uniref:IPT/TIG domain-containing protein n=1 Tax=Sphaerisporangium sp. NPDC051017 TaxID=3154636 RepID=UPI003412777A
MSSTTSTFSRGPRPRGRLRGLALRGTLAVALAAGGLAAVAPAAQAATTVTFSYTGGAQTFTVPDGVTSIVVDAFGAQGQAGPGQVPGGAGGRGGEAKATLAVTPGQELQINVGGTGGYGGGGAGGKGGNVFGYLDGGAGGGASDVRTGPGYGLDDRVLVAGGGGGGGNFDRGYAGGGGDGGGAAGASGGSSSLGANPGGGATSSAGGSGGAGSYGADAGADGTAGTGGAGGAEVPGGTSGAGGGGGGGGWYGGGGGGGGEWAGPPTYARASAGGGGGSGYGPAGTTFQTGVRSGNGVVIITYYQVPAITGISPASGPTTGGTTVTITGADLTGATAVVFGDTAASFTVDSDTQITATSPATTAAGAVDVKVTTPGGTTATTNDDKFTYVNPAPTITAVNPATGPAGGGTSVTITGTNLTGATAVAFGGTAATSFTVNSATSITATSPAATAAGAVDVKVTTPDGTSATSSAGTFTYTKDTTKLQAQPLLLSLTGGALNINLHPSATLTDTTTGRPVAGQTVTFKVGTHTVCSATTDSSGVASCYGLCPLTTILLNLSYTATFAGTPALEAATGTAGLIQL